MFSQVFVHGEDVGSRYRLPTYPPYRNEFFFYIDLNDKNWFWLLYFVTHCRSPFLPAHSMSKLSTLRGAMFCHSPSAGCDTSASQATSTSSWQRDFFSALSRTLYFPAGSSIQLHPTMWLSAMYLQTNVKGTITASESDKHQSTCKTDERINYKTWKKIFAFASARRECSLRLGTFYRPQTKLQKGSFHKRVSRILSTRRGGEVYTPQADTPPSGRWLLQRTVRIYWNAFLFFSLLLSSRLIYIVFFLCKRLLKNDFFLKYKEGSFSCRITNFIGV